MKLQPLMTIAGISAVSIVAVGYLATTPVFNSLFSKLSLASTMNSTQLSAEQAAMIETIKQICRVMAEPNITSKALVRRFGPATHEYGEYMLFPLDQYFDSLQLTEGTDRLEQENPVTLTLSSQSWLTLGSMKQVFGDYKKSNAPRFHPSAPEEAIFETRFPEFSNHVYEMFAAFHPDYESKKNLDVQKVTRIDIYMK
jgi:hypothetical protein